MDIGVISMRYARALLLSSLSEKNEDVVYREMCTLAKSFIDVPQIRDVIDNPMLSAEKKIHILVTACGGSPSPLTVTFLKLVLKEDREKMLQFMANSYVTLYRKRKGLIPGKLITAVAVSPQTENKVRQMVEKRTHGTVEFQTEVDPDIIGGFILEYDTYRLDESVKTRLRTVLSALKK